MAVCQNLVPLVNIKIAGKWMFIPLKMVLIGIDPYPHLIMILTVLKEGVPKWATWQAKVGCSWGSTQTQQGMLGPDVTASIYTHLQPCAGSLPSGKLT